MLRYTLHRIAASVVLLFLVVSATFFLIQLPPGDPTTLLALDGEIGKGHRARMIELYGLDRPLLEQYVTWMRSVVLEGDWGQSFINGDPATTRLARALPNTLILVFAVLVVRYGVGLLLGVAAAVRHRGWLDRNIRLTTLVLFALPSFWLAFVARELLSVHLGWFPIANMRSHDAYQLGASARLLDLAHHLVLPALVLGLNRCGRAVRLVRNTLLDVLEQDYVRAARARGLSRARVLFGHALPNALGPLVQDFGLVLPTLLSGSLIIETIFSWPGLGRETFTAILNLDYPVILASTALAGALVVLGSLLADLLQAWLDPRIRDAH